MEIEFIKILYDVANTLIKAGVEIVKTKIEAIGEHIEEKIRENEYVLDVYETDEGNYYDDWSNYEAEIKRIRNYIIMNMGGIENIVSFRRYYARYNDGFEYILYDLKKTNFYKLKNYAKVYVSESRESIILLPKINSVELNKVCYLID